MRVMGLDYGERRIGVALSDELGLTAQILEVYERRDRRSDLAHLAELVRTTGAGLIVVGLPLNMNGSRGPAALAAERFARELSRAAGRDTIMVDERLSTVAAQRDLLAMNLRRGRRREVIDGAAAAIILQGYLDGRRRFAASDRREGEE